MKGQPVGMEIKRQTLDIQLRENLEFSMESLSGFFSSSFLIEQQASLKSTWIDMTYIGIPCTIALY